MAARAQPEWLAEIFYHRSHRSSDFVTVTGKGSFTFFGQVGDAGCEVTFKGYLVGSDGCQSVGLWTHEENLCVPCNHVEFFRFVQRALVYSVRLCFLFSSRALCVMICGPLVTGR